MNKIVKSEIDEDHQQFLDFIKKAIGTEKNSEAIRFCLRFTVLNLYRVKNIKEI